MFAGRIKAVGRKAAVAALAMVGLSSTPAVAKNKHEIDAMGQAAIIDGDNAKGRDDAIKDALRKAVEQKVGTIIESSTITQNFEMIEDKIYARSQGFVKEFRVLSEGEKDGVYQVNIRAVVLAGKIRDDINAGLLVIRGKNVPRVLVMMSEQNIGDPTAKSWWGSTDGFSANIGTVENTFINEWIPKGLKFVDRQALLGKLTIGPAMSKISPDDKEIIEFGQKSGAEIVVIGKALAVDQGSLYGKDMHSYRGDMSVRIINLDDAVILATTTESAVAHFINPTTGGTKALQAVAKKAAAVLLTKILERWRVDIHDGGTITVTFNAVKKSKQLRTLEKFMRNHIRGVTDVRQRSYRKKVATLEVDMEGSAQDLAIILEEKKWPGFSIEIDEITANTVTAVLTK